MKQAAFRTLPFQTVSGQSKYALHPNSMLKAYLTDWSLGIHVCLTMGVYFRKFNLLLLAR